MTKKWSTCRHYHVTVATIRCLRAEAEKGGEVILGVSTRVSQKTPSI